MGATGYTSGDPRKVDITGDTMTGTLVLDDDSPAASEEFVAEYVTDHGGGGGNVPATRRVDTAAPLTGGGDLSANRTLAVSGATTSTRGVVALAGDLAGTADAPTVPGLDGKLSMSGGTMTGTLTLSDGSPAASRQYVTDHAGGGGGTVATLPLFNVEDAQYAGGAKGDGTTDDYAAIKAAWDDLISAGAGYLFFPRRAVYRIDATNRLTAGVDGQYALFPIPDVLSNTDNPKRIYGILGVGEANVIRSFAGVGTDTAVNVTASVLQVDYDTAFEWSTDHGLPSVFGAKDADKSGSGGNVHFRVEHLVLRQPPNPSMCGLNLENVTTAHIVDYYADVSGFLDAAPEPTHPTGLPLLMPKTGNAVQVKIDNMGVWGYYGGLPITEHCDTISAIIVRCKVGVFIRRTESAHFAHVNSLSMEQCTWGLAGLDPSAAGPNLGVTAAPNWVVKIDFWDVEDFDGELSSMYTPTNGAHIYDPNDVLKGGAWWGRVDSGSDHGDFETAYVVGGSNFNLLKLSAPLDAVSRLDGTAPANPDLDPPDAPTIGTATAGDASATVAFTPAATGASAIGYTATSTPGSVTGTGTSSPITVTGLTNGTSYTFTVHASNAAGDSVESEASNSVTPAASGGGGTTYAADDFTRADSATTLGTSSGGQVWTTLNGTWGIKTNAAYLAADGGGNSYNVAVLDTGHGLATYTIDLTPQNNPIDLGLVVNVQDIDNLIFWDISGDPGGNPTGMTTRLFHRAGGFTGITSAATIEMHPATTYHLKMVVGATQIDCYINDVLIFSSSGATGLESQTKYGLIMATAQVDQTSVWDNLLITDGG